METKILNSQLSNYRTYIMHRNQCLTMAENVFKIGNIIKYCPMIDIDYVNKTLLRDGSIAWFYDDILNEILALEYINLGTLDIYGRPTKIQAVGKNGYRKTLKQGEFVIMYDNNSHNSIYLDICQYAERIALNNRVCDINIAQQRMPRIWKVPQEKVESFKLLIEDIDSNVDSVMAYEDLDIDDSSSILAPAPFVADKIDIHNEKIWNEFLRLIGVANLTVQKKERNIKDEILASQGGTIASRNSRFEPRQRAIEQINKLFKINLTVEFYDGVPSTEDEKNEDIKDGDENDL